ncbi:MAG: hypothetical protein J2P23_13365 [Microlunatus sp.]|nr:hypothetical protein [Microlunatus sp.]
MNVRPRIIGGLRVLLLLGLGGTLLTPMPVAAAAKPTTVALTPPVLTTATYDGDNVVGLGWQPSATAASTRFYDILANGNQVEQLDAQQNGGSILGGAVLLDRTGASPTATYTVVAEDAAGTKSAPSNGLVPVNQDPLPKPIMKSAVISGSTVTYTWEPTVSDAASITYHVIARGGYQFASVENQTTVTAGRTISIDTGPTGIITQTLQPGDDVQVFATDSNGERSPYSNAVNATE